VAVSIAAENGNFGLEVRATGIGIAPPDESAACSRSSSTSHSRKDRTGDWLGFGAGPNHIVRRRADRSAWETEAGRGSMFFAVCTWGAFRNVHTS